MTMIGVGPKIERLLRAPGPCALIWTEGTLTGTNFMRPDHPKSHGQEDWKNHRPERGRHLPFRFKESGQVIFPRAHLSFSSCGQLLGLIERIRYDFCNDQRRRSLALEHQYLIIFFYFTYLWSQSFSKCRREGSRRVASRGGLVLGKNSHDLEKLMSYSYLFGPVRSMWHPRTAIRS